MNESGIIISTSAFKKFSWIFSGFHGTRFVGIIVAMKLQKH